MKKVSKYKVTSQGELLFYHVGTLGEVWDKTDKWQDLQYSKLGYCPIVDIYWDPEDD